jgi:hypothetical protein
VRMRWKMNNPGCPCCDCPCACYKFEDDLSNSAGGGTLEKHDAAGSHSFVTGKIGKGLKQEYNSTYNRNAVKTAHKSCFSLKGGMSVWFWQYYDTPNCGLGIQSSYIFRKGDGEALGGTDVPEWTYGRAANPICSASSIDTVLFGVGQTDNTMKTVGTNPYGGLGSEPPWGGGDGGGPYPFWSFTFLYFDPDASTHGTMYISVDADDWREDTLTAPPKYQQQPLYIGSKISTADVYSLIDEVGFCEDIGTPGEMQARATSLYNSGTGKTCMEWE